MFCIHSLIYDIFCQREFFEILQILLILSILLFSIMLVFTINLLSRHWSRFILMFIVYDFILSQFTIINFACSTQNRFLTLNFKCFIRMLFSMSNRIFIRVFGNMFFNMKFRGKQFIRVGNLIKCIRNLRLRII